LNTWEPSLLKVFEADAPSGELPCRFTRHFGEQLTKIIKWLVFFREVKNNMMDLQKEGENKKGRKQIINEELRFF